ncbi:MAG: hypothetical protein GX837_06690 [Methanomicrobiales archaeon]|jgi:hypothetical protein|nr:hypothetical protein [Methanomicrobiales archaeon]
MKPSFVLASLLVAMLLICGCTGTTSEGMGTVAAPTATTTETPQSATPVAIATETPVPPTAQPTVYIPKYTAGEVLMNTDATDIRLITKISQGKYQMRTVTRTDDDLYIKADKSFQEMGSACDARDFDKMEFESLGLVDSAPVRDVNGDIYGYLEYQDRSSMKFERPSPKKLTGDVKYILEIWYSGDARVYASIGGATTTKTYMVNGYSALNLGKDDRAFVSVSKDDYGSGTLKATLKADGVIVAEGETNDKYGHISLSFYT